MTPKAKTRKVSTKGSAAQNQLEANINSKMIPTKETRNKIQYIPLETVFVFSIIYGL